MMRSLCVASLTQRSAGSHQPQRFNIVSVNELRGNLPKQQLGIVTLYAPSSQALFTRCTILWMGQWKRSSMRTVPTMMAGVRDLLAVDAGGNLRGIDP